MKIWWLFKKLGWRVPQPNCVRLFLRSWCYSFYTSSSEEDWQIFYSPSLKYISLATNKNLERLTLFLDLSPVIDIVQFVWSYVLRFSVCCWKLPHILIFVYVWLAYENSRPKIFRSRLEWEGRTSTWTGAKEDGWSRRLTNKSSEGDTSEVLQYLCLPILSN